MSKAYANPPVVEVVSELLFTADSEWDMAIPGLVYEKLSDEFPQRRQVRVVSAGIRDEGEEPSLRWRTEDRIQFVREDETALVQLGQHLLAVNHLKPYPTWAGFRPLVERALQAYQAAAQPKGARTIRLRYINHIDVPGSSPDLGTYLTFRPLVGPSTLQDSSAFLLGVQVPHEGGRDVLKVELTTIESESSDSVRLLLDLDYFLAKPGDVTVDDVPDWLEAAHRRVEDAFEECITDALRERFGEGGDA